MLIKSQSGERIVRAHNVALDHFAPTSTYALLAADGIDPEGVLIALYRTRAEAQQALDYILTQAAQGKPADLSLYYGSEESP